MFVSPKDSRSHFSAAIRLNPTPSSSETMPLLRYATISITALVTIRPVPSSSKAYMYLRIGAYLANVPSRVPALGNVCSPSFRSISATWKCQAPFNSGTGRISLPSPGRPEPNFPEISACKPTLLIDSIRPLGRIPLKAQSARFNPISQSYHLRNVLRWEAGLKRACVK